jgi:glycosyltransferase involved in cell wall biosynthesis
MNNELVSVAMCTFNGALYLEEQLDSILDQSHQNIEVVIFDDCSQDNTWQILQSYAARDKRIRLHRNQSNVGFVKNFENAIAACQGKFIALSDQDDIWYENKIERLLSCIGDNWLIYSRVKIIDMHGSELPGDFPRCRRVEGSCALALVLKNCVTGHACLIRRELFELARSKLADMPYHDQWLAIVAASRGKLKAGTDVLSYYRMHDNNVVLGAKRGSNSTKIQRVTRSYDGIMKVIDVVIDSDVLSQSDQYLLENLRVLFAINPRVVFNLKLRRFLRENSEHFLLLIENREKYIRRICRGRRYYYLMPFA